MPETWIELADAISALRTEIGTSMLNATDKSLQFRLDTVEMEFSVEVKKNASGDGRINFGVVTFGAAGGVSSADTHRVKLVMTPNDEFGQNPMIADYDYGRPEH